MTRPPADTAATAEWWRPVPPAVADRAKARDGRTTVAVRESDVPFWALLTFTFIQVLAPQSFIPALGPLRIALLAGLVAIGAYVVRRPAGGPPGMMRTRARSVRAGPRAGVVVS